LVAVLRALTAFLAHIEARSGVRLQDPLLSALRPRDCTWFIFATIYAAIAVAAGVLAQRPRALLVGLQAYILMIALRMAVMQVTALDPPIDAIPLQDPLIERLATGRLLTRDLFFSGHTATLFLLFLSVPGRVAKVLLLTCTAAVAVAVLFQHVHYTVDVLVAPCFAFASHGAVTALHAQFSAQPTKAVKEAGSSSP
jgi:PAP2 superfamily C-terminal